MKTLEYILEKGHPSFYYSESLKKYCCRFKFYGSFELFSFCHVNLSDLLDIVYSHTINHKF